MSDTVPREQYYPKPTDEGWGMATAWNEIIGKGTPEREMVERDYIWASELGKPNIEIFLSMKGVVPSNPPNERSHKKFLAGNVFEWIVSMMLQRAGIMQETQTRHSYQYPDTLRVSGRIDFLVGGVPQFDAYHDKMMEMGAPEGLLLGAEGTIKYLTEKFPEGLPPKYLEIKSCSSFSMNAMEQTGRSSRVHRLQLFHYLKSANHLHGNVVYLCRDDMRMLEVPLRLDDQGTEKDYHDTMIAITKYYNAHKNTKIEEFIVSTEEGREFVWKEGMPPLEKHIVWDDDYGKFVRNWGVEYSNYLTMLYGFESQKDFEDAVIPIVMRWNRVMTRLKKAQARNQWLSERQIGDESVVKAKIEGTRGYRYYVVILGEEVPVPEKLRTGYEMTAKNLEVLLEIKEAGFEINELLGKFAGEEEEEN
jgi:hypothetical protein